MQWNSRGVTNKTPDIIRLSNKFDILIFCETFLKQNKKDNLNSLKHFKIIRSDRIINKGGGLVIAIRKNLIFSRIQTIFSQENELETLAVLINSSRGEILLVSIYRVPGNQTPTNHWKNLFNSIKNSGIKNVLICGDFNSHNTLWGSAHNCTNGHNLCAELDKTDFIVLNNGTPTHVARPPDLASCLDLTLVSSNLYLALSWNVHDDLMRSDHYPIFTTLGITIPISPSTSHKYNLRTINWPLFCEDLCLSLKSNLDLFNTQNPISHYNHYVELIDKLINIACPQPKPNHTVSRNSKLIRKPYVPAPWFLFLKNLKLL